MGMPKDRSRHGRAALAGAVIVVGASAITQSNGGLISSAYADENPKETISTTVKKPQQPAQPAVQQPKEKGGKKGTTSSSTAAPK
jgi:hypothetical protein